MFNSSVNKIFIEKEVKPWTMICPKRYNLIHWNFLLGTTVSAQGGDWIPPPPPPCMPGDAWQEGCILKSCSVNGMQESLAPECVKLIEKKVEEIVVKKLAERGWLHIFSWIIRAYIWLGIECSSEEETTVTQPTRYETPGRVTISKATMLTCSL